MKLFTALAAASMSKVFAACDGDMAACTAAKTACWWNPGTPAVDADSFSCSVPMTASCTADGTVTDPADAGTQMATCNGVKPAAADCVALSTNCVGKILQKKAAKIDAYCMVRPCLAQTSKTDCEANGCVYTAAVTGKPGTWKCASQANNNADKATACNGMKTGCTATTNGGAACCLSVVDTAATGSPAKCADAEAKSGAAAVATGAFAAAAAALLM
jgi:hypothetical protein